MSHTPSGTADRADALACHSAVALLRSGQQGDLGDEEFAVCLEGLLSAVGLELEADLESVPKTVRWAAVVLAEHIVRGSSIPVPRRRALARTCAGGDEPGWHHDHATGVPFSRSVRLGRMG